MAHFITFSLYDWQHFLGWAPSESEDNSESTDDSDGIESLEEEHIPYTPRKHDKPTGMGILLAKEHSVIKHLDDKLHSEVNIIAVIYSSSS